MGKEKEFETKIKNYLKSKGIVPFGYPSRDSPIGYYEKRFGTMGQKRGKPDLHIVIGGYSLEVELKAPNKKPEPLQLRNLIMILRTNTCAMVVTPNEMDELKQVVSYLLEGDHHKAMDICAINVLSNYT